MIPYLPPFDLRDCILEIRRINWRDYLPPFEVLVYLTVFLTIIFYCQVEGSTPLSGIKHVLVWRPYQMGGL